MAITLSSVINSMGVSDFAAAIAAGTMTKHDVLKVLDARIAKRQRDGKLPIAKVIQYRNELAAESNAVLGTQLPAIPVPTYAKPVATTTGLPTDMADLIAHVKLTIPQASLPAFIAAIATN
jgi:hypothetical protein